MVIITAPDYRLLSTCVLLLESLFLRGKEDDNIVFVTWSYKNHQGRDDVTIRHRRSAGHSFVEKRGRRLKGVVTGRTGSTIRFAARLDRFSSPFEKRRIHLLPSPRTGIHWYSHDGRHTYIRGDAGGALQGWAAHDMRHLQPARYEMVGVAVRLGAPERAQFWNGYQSQRRIPMVITTRRRQTIMGNTRIGCQRPLLLYMRNHSCLRIAIVERNVFYLNQSVTHSVCQNNRETRVYQATKYIVAVLTTNIM